MSADFHPVYLEGDQGKPVLLLLHGTGGDEHDLIPLAQQVAPDFGILSIRGQVTENGQRRFFRRLGEGVFDMVDLQKRTEELADFLTTAKTNYQFENRKLIALGYSNGANIAVSLLFHHPDSLDGAVLLRAMLPYDVTNRPVLKDKRLLILSGVADPLVPVAQIEKLVSILQQGEATVTHIAEPASHALTAFDAHDTQEFLQFFLSQ